MTFNFKYALPHVAGRGAGLGNEMIPWARAFVAGTVLGAKVLPPAFGLNKRQYWRHFDTSRTDWIKHRALMSLLPKFEFTENDFYKYGAGSLVDSIKQFAVDNKLDDRSAWVVTTQGMWGGYRHVIEAREFIRSTFYLSRFAALNLLKIKSRLDPKLITVGMHVRLGDFKPEINEVDYCGKFNIALPLQWYINIVKNLQSQLGKNVQFLVVSDGTTEQLAPLLNECNAVTTLDIPDSDVSDMLALADADLLVCSVSSYSAWAAFLSDAPYLWFEPNLQKIDGYHSIWGHETRQKQPSSYTRFAIQENEINPARKFTARGLPVEMDGVVPSTLIDSLIRRHGQYQLAADLVCYGVTPLKSSK